MDGGDMLFGPSFSPAGPYAEIPREGARLIARAVVRMGVAAVNVGRLDLRDGLPFVEQLGRKWAVPWVSANLRLANGDYPFPRFRVLSWGEKRVAILGVLRPDPGRDETLGIQVSDPAAAVREVVGKLPDVTAVLCLSDLGLQEEKRLAKAVPGLTAIVGGSHELLVHPQVSGRTLLLHAGDRGRYLGVLDLASTSLGQAGNSLPFRADRVVPLGASVRDDPEIASWIAAYRRSEVAIRREIGLRAVRAEPGRPAPGQGKVRVDLGSSKCARCHAKAYQSWLRTSHARSYESLSGRAKDTRCLECHATLLYRRSGALTEPDVACEACHGAGGSHRTRGDIDRRPGPARCLRCHRGFHEGKKFDYASAYAKVRCGL